MIGIGAHVRFGTKKILYCKIGKLRDVCCGPPPFSYGDWHRLEIMLLSGGKCMKLEQQHSKWDPLCPRCKPQGPRRKGGSMPVQYFCSVLHLVSDSQESSWHFFPGRVTRFNGISNELRLQCSICIDGDFVYFVLVIGICKIYGKSASWQTFVTENNQIPENSLNTSSSIFLAFLHPACTVQFALGLCWTF